MESSCFKSTPSSSTLFEKRRSETFIASINTDHSSSFQSIKADEFPEDFLATPSPFTKPTNVPMTGDRTVTSDAIPSTPTTAIYSPLVNSTPNQQPMPIFSFNHFFPADFNGRFDSASSATNVYVPNSSQSTLPSSTIIHAPTSAQATQVTLPSPTNIDALEPPQDAVPSLNDGHVSKPTEVTLPSSENVYAPRSTIWNPADISLFSPPKSNAQSQPLQYGTPSYYAYSSLINASGNTPFTPQNGPVGYMGSGFVPPVFPFQELAKTLGERSRTVSQTGNALNAVTTQILNTPKSANGNNLLTQYGSPNQEDSDDVDETENQDPTTPKSDPTPKRAMFPGKYTAEQLKEILQKDLSSDQYFDTVDCCRRVASDLKYLAISQTNFAETILARSQGTLSDILKNPKKYHELKYGKETYRRMLNWVSLDAEAKRYLSLKSKEEMGSLTGLTYPGARKRTRQNEETGQIEVAEKKTRLSFTDKQRKVLHDIFKYFNERPTMTEMKEIGVILSLDYATVSNFFMNSRRRQRIGKPLAGDNNAFDPQLSSRNESLQDFLHRMNPTFP